MNPGRNSFYTRAGSGWPKTRSTLFSFSAVDQDPDGSGSIQRSWSVSLIRIHQIRGYGLGFLWFFLLSFSFLMFLLYTPLILANWTFCMPKILLKIPSFFTACFYYFFLGVLCYFSWRNWIKIYVCSFVLIGVCFVVFSAFRMWCSFQFCVMCLWYLMRVLCDILQYYWTGFLILIMQYYICLLNLIFDYYFVMFPFVC